MENMIFENTIFENTQWKKTKHHCDISLYASQKNLCFAQKPILIVGGVHGDEPEGVWLCEKLLESLKALSRKGHRSNHSSQKDWILIPCLNPEGLQTLQRTNKNGVDLNRNFPAPDWTSEHSQPRYNPGPHSASELETQALIEVIETYKPALIIHCHSWKPSIVFTSVHIPKEAQILAEASQYELQSDIGYPTPGSLGQYGFFQHGIPVICIEEQEGATQQETWARFQSAFYKILNLPPEGAGL